MQQGILLHEDRERWQPWLGWLSSHGANCCFAQSELDESQALHFAFASWRAWLEKDDALQALPWSVRRVALVEQEQRHSALKWVGKEIDDLLPCPISEWELSLVLARGKLRSEALGRGIEEGELSKSIVGVQEGGGLNKVWKKVKKSSIHNAEVLLTGESGTGKELMARAIHRLSGRKGGFVAVNCAAIPESLLESELFGHKKGAFTGATGDRVGVFERACGGTLFLDEIGDLPLNMQVKLLRALQTREIHPLGSEEGVAVDFRLVSATSRDLKSMMQVGNFRNDLYYRLAVIGIELPPLRDRKQDLPKLLNFFLEKFSAKHHRARSFSHEAKEKLAGEPWQGNVRELENTIERLVILSERDCIDVAEVERELRPQENKGSIPELSLGNRGLKEAMRDAEAMFIGQALERCNGRRGACAELLGISKRSLLYKIKDYNL